MRSPGFGRRAPALDALAALVASLCCVCNAAWAQAPARLPTGPDQLPTPRKVAATADAKVQVPGPTAEEFLDKLRVPISLPTALRLALSSSLDIAQAREAVARARADLLRARVLLLPDFAIAADYTNHQGQIQKTEGNIETVNRDALFVGGGPALSFAVVDAIYGPGIARLAVAATQAGFQRVNNDALLAVGDAYLNVLRARRRLATISETIRLLTAERIRVEGQSYPGLLPMVQSFIAVGGKAVLRSELYRVEVEILRRRQDLRAAMQDYELAVAELARLLRLDPQTPLLPAEDFRWPMRFACEGYGDQPPAVLVRTALNNRPELAENRAVVQAALQRVKIAKARPFLPTATTTLSWGDFGGGPNLNPPYTKVVNGKPTTITNAGYGPSGIIDQFEPRLDFEAILTWRLRNLGFGNRVERQEQQAIYRQANWRLLAVQDQVIAQVIEAQENVQAWRDRLNITRAALFDAQGQPVGPVFTSIRLNFERIQGGEARPLEVLDAIRSLSDQLDLYGQASTEYERSQFRLLIALGMPPPALLNCVTPATTAPPVPPDAPAEAAAVDLPPLRVAGSVPPPSSVLAGSPDRVAGHVDVQPQTTH